MKKSLCFFIFLIFILATGCSPQLHHPTKSGAERTADHEDCEQQVRASIRESEDAYDVKDEVILIRKCMDMKGWK